MQQVALTDGVQLPAFVSANLFAFALVLCRVGPFFVLAPVLSANLLPARAKFAAAAAISVALAPIAAQGRAVPQDPVGLAMTFAQEIGVGLALALALSVLAAAVSAGASLVDTLVGFSFGSLVDPITGVNASVVGQVYTLFAMMILVVTGGVELMIMGLARSYDMIPIGTFPAPSQLGQLAVKALTEHPADRARAGGPGDPRGRRRGRRIRSRGPCRAADERLRHRPAGQGDRGVRRDRRHAAVRRHPPRGRPARSAIEQSLSLLATG